MPGPIRTLETLDELDAAVALQEEVWGEGFSERVPSAILKIAAGLGGVTAGAFDEDRRLVGFVFGITGVEDGQPVHWSHMLAVRPGHRGAGLGRRLKMYQRERLLELGVTRTYWTFDPLQSRNAWLNFARLGAVATQYLPDMYGDTDSPLHRHVGTDRLLAVWEMDSDRVEARLAEGGTPPGASEVEGLPRAFAVERGAGLPRPSTAAPYPPAPPFLVPVPRSIAELLAADPGIGRVWRAATRAALQPALESGAQARELIPLDDSTSALLVEVP